MHRPIDGVWPEISFNLHIFELQPEHLCSFRLWPAERRPDAARIDDADPDEARQNLRKYLEGLTGELNHLGGESGHVSAWSSQASCKSGLYRIVSTGHHDRIGRGGSMCVMRGLSAVGYDDIDSAGHQRLSQSRQSIQIFRHPNS